jgi:hypothetical protein
MQKYFARRIASLFHRWSAAIHRRSGFGRELIPGPDSDNELSHSIFTDIINP